MTDNEHADQEAHEIELDEAAAHAEEGDHFSDQPPVDDFEDEATVSVEEHGEEDAHHEEGAEDDAAPQPSKSGKIIFLGAIAGVVILVGGLVYTQFFGSSDAPAQHPHAAPAMQTAAANLPVPPGATLNTPPSTTSNVPPVPAGGDDISSLKSIQTAQTENQQAALTGVQGDKPVDVITQHSDPAAPPSVTSGDQKLIGVPSIPAVAATDTKPKSAVLDAVASSLSTVPPVPAVTAPAVVPSVPAVPNIPVTAATVTKAATAVATIPTVPAIPAKPAVVAPPSVNSVVAAVPAVTPAAPVQAAADKAAEARIASLTAQVATLQQSFDQAMDKLNHVAATMTPVGTPIGTPVASAPMAIAQVGAPHVMHHATPHTSAAHKRSTVTAAKTSKHASAKVAAAKKSSHWVLRAAVPGEAWIATSAATSDLRHVKVGDSVPGLGQVTSIVSSGDSWVVQGTQGSAH